MIRSNQTRRTNTRRGSRVRRWIGRLFLLVGVAAIGVWVASNVVPTVWQDWDSWVFDREVRGDSASLKEYLEDKRFQIADNLRVWWTGVWPATRPPHEVARAASEPRTPSPE